MPEVTIARGAGRPRDPQLDERVLAATRELLVEVGWDAMSVRGIAERSGVSRAAIARRWPSRPHLALDAILGFAPDLSRFEGTDRAGWVEALVDGAFELFERPEVRAAVPGLLAALRDHEDLRSAIWTGFGLPAAALSTEDASSAIAVAAGAALFATVVAPEEAVAVRRRLVESLS